MRLRYYVLTWTANGTIAQPVAWLGSFDRIFSPVQMWNERGQLIPQPYPDQPGTERVWQANYNIGCWFVNFQDLPPQFTWHQMTEHQWTAVSNTPWCFQWDGQQVSLRPGHVLSDNRKGAFCRYADYLKMTHTAFGGMPVYQIRHWSKRRPEDFPDIVQAGLFHPWWKEPTPVEIHPMLRVKRVSLEEGRPLAAHPENQGHIAQAVGLQKQAQGLVMVPVGYVAGVGTN
jgi:hypothetical protein